MPNPLAKRFAFWKDIYYGKVRVGMAIFITASTILLIIRDLFVAPEHRNFAILKYVPQWPWYSWALIGLVGLILLTLEGSYSKFQRDQIRFRGAYRAKSKAAKAQHRSELATAHLHGSAHPHQASLTPLPSVREVASSAPIREEQRPQEAREVPHDRPVSVALSDRLILGITPEYLSGIYLKHTGVQADRLIEIYVDKWLSVSGAIRNVAGPYQDSSVVVQLKSGEFGVMAEFIEQRWIDYVVTLQRGTIINVVGKLQKVDSGCTTWLKECELAN